MQQSPAVDVVAIGFESGHILLVNLLYAEVLMKFRQTQDQGPIKSLSFSSDTSVMEVSLLASVTESRSGGSSIVFWDLNKQ